MLARLVQVSLGVPLVVFFACSIVACGSSEKEAADSDSAGSGQESDSAIKLTSSAFRDGRAIPKRFTEDGKDLSPPLAWSGIPDGTQQLAIICDDPDAPTDEPWVHWVIYGIPADVMGLPEGLPATDGMNAPVIASQGKNSWPTVGYRGPAPPPGDDDHHYHFRIYALSAKLDVHPGWNKTQLMEKMQGKILATGKLVGTYKR